MTWWNKVNVKGNKAEIMILGDIGSSWWASVDTKRIREELARIDNVDEIILRIDSPGGSVFAGIGLYSYLKDHKAKKKVYIDGMCASIATVIAMAGDEIYMNNASQFMIHNPWTIAIGEAKELRHDAEVLDGIRDSVINAYTTKCKLSKEDLIKAMDKTTYYKAEEALKAGFITEITHVTDAKNYAECWDTTYEKYENRYSQPSNENIEKKETKMTLDELMKNHPEVYNQVVEKSKAAERDRIKALDGLSNRVNDEGQEIVDKAKYENGSTAETIAMELITKGAILNEIPTKEPNAKNITIFDATKQDAKGIDEISGTQGEVIKDQVQEDILNIINGNGGGN